MWCRAKAAALGCAALLGSSGLVGCSGAERAVRVNVMLRAPADAVCLVAREEGPSPRVVFAMPYPASTLPSPATLTFVAGPGFVGPVELTARGVYAGSFVGGATVTTSLASPGVTDVTLPVERCRVRGTGGFSTRPGGTFAALHDPPRVVATDYDGDGKDELLAVTADGSLAVLDAESIDEGSHRESELQLLAGGAVVRAGDVDTDCRADVLVSDTSGILVVSSEDGASHPPVGTNPHDVAIGRVTRTSDPRLIVGGASGLALVPMPGAVGTITTLSAMPIDHVASWDDDADGGTEIVATGPMGLLAYRTRTGMEAPFMLPAGFDALHGPIALGDLDDDGDLDLVVAEADTLHVARRTTTDFVDATGTMPAMLDGDAVRVIAADVDGDCADDVVTLSTTGRAAVWSQRTPSTWTMLGMQNGALDLAVGDFDGDGTREIALVGTGGRVTLWQP